MNWPSESRIYSMFLAAGFVAFGLEAYGIAHRASEVVTVTDSFEGLARHLDTEVREVESLAREINSQEEQLRVFKDVPNVLPKDKGYLRTQEAIAEEVAQLRKKVGKAMPRGKYILVDAKVNKLYLKDGYRTLWSADCSVGRGGTLSDRKSGRKWEFLTPRGRFKVWGKLKDPVWRKPDWAYVESGESKIPPPDDPARLVRGELGAYALNLGGGYLIHGTMNPEALGRPASHGCVRLGADDLEKLYKSVGEGTQVFIF
jgi:L,D-transpeptidase YbiS